LEKLVELWLLFLTNTSMKLDCISCSAPSMIDRAPQIKEAHDSSNRAFRVYLEKNFSELDLIRSVLPSPRMAAVGLTAIMDGLWLEWCLSSKTFSADEAISLCEQWVDAAWKHPS
jgi:TetR/AcrR family transcriptional repressor of bet genes